MSSIECPICMDVVETSKNMIVTDCGHIFHCSCLMQNVAHNGFACPSCRTKMAEDPFEEEDEDDISEDEQEEVSDHALTSFRMFQQQIDGQEPEEEPEEDWETDEDEYEDDDEADEELQVMPSAAYMAVKLMERGITYEDLIKNLLYEFHSEFGELYQDYQRRSAEVQGQFRAVISRYDPENDVPAIAPSMHTQVEVPAIAPSTHTQVEVPVMAPLMLTQVAEPKMTNEVLSVVERIRINSRVYK